VTCGLCKLEIVARNFLGDCAASVPPTCSDEENNTLEWFLVADNHPTDDLLDEPIWWTVSSTILPHYIFALIIIRSGLSLQLYTIN